MKYIEVAFKIVNEFQEILIAELGLLSFDSFEQEDKVVKAYTPFDDFVEEEVQEIIIRYQDLFLCTYEIVEHEDRNWNEEWEKNFDPVFISDQCIIRAHFHKIEKKYPYEIIITPKMSFGTGHHETTSLMIQSEFDISLQDKDVMDIGCGTGVLAIMAKKLGANDVFACDIDEWAFENAQENFELNNVGDIEIQQGMIQEVNIPKSEYDVVLANINKNVLLHDIESYKNYVKEEGYLLLSGFYQDDIQDIEACANANGFEKKQVKVNNNWVAIIFQNTSKTK